MVEANYIETETSVYSFGYYDYVHNRFRIEEHTQAAATVEIVLPDEVEYNGAVNALQYANIYFS